MKNKVHFYDAYQQLTPLEAHCFASELARQVELYQLEYDAPGADAAVIAHCLNRAFEMIGVSIYMEMEEGEEVMYAADNDVAEAAAG